jgi:radical SAM superfamily enzyme YgiQ (UPF0313 family)
MKLAFIEPSIANVEPLGIGYLAQSLIDAGHEVRYFEAPRPYLLQRVTDFAPHVLAYSVTTGKHRICQNLNSFLRRHIDAVSLFGGPHCTFYPQFIENDELIDGICRGEGEYAVVELLDKIELRQDYTATPNWWLRRGRTIYRNDLGDINDDLDALAFPNRDIIYSENPDLRDTPIKRIFGSRGCPYKCSYCFNRQYTEIFRGRVGKLFRSRSPQNIVEEIRAIQQKYPLTFLKFVEDVFAIKMNYQDFAAVYAKTVGIPFVCNLRPNLIDEDKVRSLSKAGCVAATIAVESGNDFIRNQILTRNLSAGVLDRAITTLKAEGIRVWTQNIIANPGETFEMAMETFNLNVRHGVDFAECFLLTPYPGTDVYKYCVDNGYFDGEVDTLQKSYWLGSSLRFESEREKRRLVNFQKFFSFGVQHPKTLAIIKLLIELPPNRLFVLLNRLHDAWRVSRVIRAKFTVRNFLTTVRNNFWFISSYFLKRHDGWSELPADAEKE